MFISNVVQIRGKRQALALVTIMDLSDKYTKCYVPLPDKAIARSVCHLVGILDLIPRNCLPSLELLDVSLNPNLGLDRGHFFKNITNDYPFWNLVRLSFFDFSVCDSLLWS